MMTQNQRVLGYLAAGMTLNPLQAWTELGIYRLGARIFDLRKLGYDIKSSRTAVKNRYGESCIVASYKLDIAC